MQRKLIKVTLPLGQRSVLDLESVMLQAPEDCMLPLCFEPRESVIKLGSAGSCMLLAESGKFCFGQWGVSW